MFSFKRASSSMTLSRRRRESRSTIRTFHWRTWLEGGRMVLRWWGEEKYVLLGYVVDCAEDDCHTVSQGWCAVSGRSIPSRWASMSETAMVGGEAVAQGDIGESATRLCDFNALICILRRLLKSQPNPTSLSRSIIASMAKATKGVEVGCRSRRSWLRRNS